MAIFRATLTPVKRFTEVCTAIFTAILTPVKRFTAIFTPVKSKSSHL